MIRLVYVSAAANQIAYREFPEILAKARARNRALAVTGMLLYKDGNFLQALEGKGSAVREVFETIRRDPRHKEITLLLHEIDNKCLFGKSPMGFKNLTIPDPIGFPDFTPLINTPLRNAHARRDLRDCLELLQFFGNDK